MTHVPVLSREVLEYLDTKKGNKFVDGTVGDGGHLFAILQSNEKARVLGIDLDQTSLDDLRKEVAKKGLDQNVVLAQGNYKDIDQIIADTGFGKVDGILLDLGFSSRQLNDSSRGLSFQSDGPLDMRYDSSQALTAEAVVNT